MAGLQDYLITNVLIPVEDKGPNGYSTVDVLLSGGKIASIVPAGNGVLPAGSDGQVIDGTHKMLLPGFVNSHTHSVQMWGRGLCKMLPLELWLPQTYAHGDPRSRDPSASSHMVYLAALLTGVETIMSGGTAVMDHLFVRNMEDLGAAVRAYKQLGLRAYIAPMAGDMPRTNYVALVPNAAERNEAAQAEGGPALGGLGHEGALREEFPEADPAETQRVLALWKEAVEQFHRPEDGISIAIGPVQVTSVSEELIRGAVEIRRQHGLAGHIHLLETRGQRLQSRQKHPNGGPVKWLADLGWLDLPATSCAHTVWLEEEEQRLMAERGAVAVHNPVANCRLGSGIAPIGSYLANGMTVAVGCDGPASNDAQNLLEVIKLACILNPLTTPEYRKWVSPRQVLQMASEGGAAVLGLQGRIGALREGYEADVALYDLTALSLLPRTDPIGLLVLGRPSAGVGGNALHSVWARGRLVLQDGVPVGVDLGELRKELAAGQPEYRDPAITEPNGHAFEFEVEFRACMGLDGPTSTPENAHLLQGFPKYRVNYDADYV